MGQLTQVNESGYAHAHEVSTWCKVSSLCKAATAVKRDMNRQTRAEKTKNLSTESWLGDHDKKGHNRERNCPNFQYGTARGLAVHHGHASCQCLKGPTGAKGAGRYMILKYKT